MRPPGPGVGSSQAVRRPDASLAPMAAQIALRFGIHPRPGGAPDNAGMPTLPVPGPVDPTAGFHPAVAGWFARAFPGGATDAQREAWPAIRDGRHVLVAAPTGS